MPSSSRFFSRFIGLTAVFAGLGALGASACGDDEAIVRQRVDGGSVTTEGGPVLEAGPGVLGCGVAIPSTFVAPSFASNAAVELALAQNLDALDTKMASTEGSSTTVISAADLGALYNAGSPSLRTVSTSFTQATVDAYLTAFGTAGGKTWQPTDPDADGGPTTGGKYSVLFYESPVGLDLRAATTKTLLGGALYNDVLGLVAAPITDATVDRLLAAFGASASLAGRTDIDAGADSDRLIAALASKRTDKAAATPGIYAKIRTALLSMKAAVAAGDICRSDVQVAVASFLLEWEHATFASAIFSLNAAATSAADPAKGAVSLHSFADAVGLLQSFKGLPVEKRNIKDSQIDPILVKIGANTPYKLVTDPGTRVLALTSAIDDIALYESFSAADVESFKKSF